MKILTEMKRRGLFGPRLVLLGEFVFVVLSYQRYGAGICFCFGAFGLGHGYYVIIYTHVLFLTIVGAVPSLLSIVVVVVNQLSPAVVDTELDQALEVHSLYAEDIIVPVPIGLKADGINSSIS